MAKINKATQSCGVYMIFLQKSVNHTETVKYYFLPFSESAHMFKQAMKICKKWKLNTALTTKVSDIPSL